jgi:hypothetical protein
MLNLAVTFIARLTHRRSAYEKEAVRIAGLRNTHLKEIDRLERRIAEVSEDPKFSTGEQMAYAARRTQEIATHRAVSDLLRSVEADYRNAASQPWRSHPLHSRQPIEESDASAVARRYLAREYPRRDVSKCKLECTPLIRQECGHLHWRVWFTYPRPSGGDIEVDVAPDGNCVG